VKADLPWSLLAVAWLPGDRMLSAQTALRALMPHFAFASCVPFGSGGALAGGAAERSGLLFRAADTEAASPELLAEIEALLGLAAPESLRYADARQGQHRAARLVRSDADPQEARLDAFLLGGDTRAEAWLKPLLQDQLPAQAFGRQLLRPGATAPVPMQARGKVVCSCFGVTETAIRMQLPRCAGSARERLAALQGELKCGTNCGSCLPELQRMLHATPAAAEVVLS
jgi:assimilatory nitrate reductase catalytic subunit